MDERAASPPQRQTTFSFWQLFCFGVLTAPLAMGGLAVVTYLPTFYAVDMGLGLGLVGMVFVIGRLIDIITDPLIGHWSDETRTRLGPRKPWLMVGVLGFSLSVWLLFTPSEDASLIYLVATSGLYFLFYTVLDVPYSATGLEISPHVHERSLLAGSKAIFQVVGALAAATLPVILAVSIADSLERIAQAIVLLCGMGLALFMLFVPDKQRLVTTPRFKILTAIHEVWKNRPYRYLLGSFLIVQTANSFVAALTVLFVTHIIGAPELIGMFLGILLLSSAFFLPLWIMISKRLDKKKSWMIAILTAVSISMLLPFLGQGDIINAAVLCALLGGTFGCDSIMPTSMLADIVYENEEQGANRLGGLYLAVKNSVSKLSFIAPMGLAFPVLGMIGFEKSDVIATEQKAVFLIFYAALPILLRLIALFILQKSPLPLSMNDRALQG